MFNVLLNIYNFVHIVTGEGWEETLGMEEGI